MLPLGKYLSLFFPFSLGPFLSHDETSDLLWTLILLGQKMADKYLYLMLLV